MYNTFQMVTFYILSEPFLTFWLGKSVCFVSWCKSSKHPLIRKRRKYELWMRVNASVYLLIILLLRMFVLLLSCQLLLIVFSGFAKCFCLCEYSRSKLNIDGNESFMNHECSIIKYFSDLNYFSKDRSD